MSSDKKQIILFVDDEVNILNALKRMLYPMNRQWEMHFAASGQEALQMMEKTPFDIIVSDMLMPEMDGTALLKKTRERHPELIRFILSGHSNLEQIYHTVGVAHQFISKPCRPDVIRNAITQALSLRNVLSNKSLISFVSGISNLPSLPDMYQRIVGLLGRENIPLGEISALVEQDIAMSAKILQMVNSAFFSLPNHVENVHQAVALLGINTLKNLVLMCNIFQPSAQNPSANAAIEVLRLHSLKVAFCAKKIAEIEGLDTIRTNTLFTSGMLHDIGRLIFFNEEIY